MAADVSIVGGGVIGLSTGVWLELAGLDTHVYTEHRPAGTRPEAAPATVASPFAAASIIPHSDSIPDVDAVMETSTAVYRRLADADSWPVRQQRHVIVHEGDRGERPAFARFVPGFRSLDPGRDPVPVREGVSETDVEGWFLEPYVVSMPQYLSRLGRLYRSVGGVVDERTITRETIGDLPGRAVVNATGVGARRLVNDDALGGALGHLVFVDGVDAVTHDGRPFSYSYHQDRPDADDVGVYAYPREGELVLGGSKLYGDVGADDEWVGEPPSDTVTVDGVDVPERILVVHDELLAGLDLDEATAAAGIRPVRDGGARVERDEIAGTPVVHNYGHGGAGVTYSWGAADLVVRHLPEPLRRSVSGTSGLAGVASDLPELIGQHDVP